MIDQHADDARGQRRTEHNVDCFEAVTIHMGCPTQVPRSVAPGGGLLLFAEIPVASVTVAHKKNGLRLNGRRGHKGCQISGGSRYAGLANFREARRNYRRRGMKGLGDQQCQHNSRCNPTDYHYPSNVCFTQARHSHGSLHMQTELSPGYPRLGICVVTDDKVF
jgi:hypothetical protein